MPTTECIAFSQVVVDKHLAFICYILVSLNVMHLQCSLTLVCGGPAAEHCVELSFDCVAEILKKSCPLISALMLSLLTCTASATNLPLASK